MSQMTNSSCASFDMCTGFDIWETDEGWMLVYLLVKSVKLFLTLSVSVSLCFIIWVWVSMSERSLFLWNVIGTTLKYWSNKKWLKLKKDLTSNNCCIIVAIILLSYCVFCLILPTCRHTNTENINSIGGYLTYQCVKMSIVSYELWTVNTRPQGQTITTRPTSHILNQMNFTPHY